MIKDRIHYYHYFSEYESPEYETSWEIKQSPLKYGINSTIFAYPTGTGEYGSAVVNVAAKYYGLKDLRYTSICIFTMQWL